MNISNENFTFFGATLNFTNIIATDLADTLPSCVIFGRSVKKRTYDDLAAFNYSVGNILLSFLF